MNLSLKLTLFMSMTYLYPQSSDAQKHTTPKHKPSRYRIIPNTTSPDKKLAFYYKFDESAGIDWSDATYQQLREAANGSVEIKCVILNVSSKREMLEVPSNNPWHSHGSEPKVSWSPKCDLCFLWDTASWYPRYQLVRLGDVGYSVEYNIFSQMTARVEQYLKSSFPAFYRKYRYMYVLWSEGAKFTDNDTLELKLNLFVPKGYSSTEAHLLLKFHISPGSQSPSLTLTSFKQLSLKIDPEELEKKK